MSNLLITLALLLGNAFFVAAEFSLITSRRTVIEPMTSTSTRARLALTAMEQLPVMIAGSQLGVTACSLGLGALAEPALAHLLHAPAQAIGVPTGLVEPLAFVLALLVVVFAHTVFGELVPKYLTLVGPERTVLWLGPPMLWFCTAARPLLVAMRWAAVRVLRIWRIDVSDDVKTVYSAEELAGLVAESRTEGLLDPEEHARITSALAMQRRTAGEAMRPWAAVTTVADNVSPANLEVLAYRTGRSRFPVVAHDTERVRGFVHVKDVLDVASSARRGPIPVRMIRPLPTVAPATTLTETLLAMRHQRRHIVLVGPDTAPLGLLTLDDVLRAVVGGEGATRSVVAR
jgi:CBS domain containing-hemolysin-like protein